MVELAPDHKTGLQAANPILLAGGTIGCGDAIPPGMRTSLLGAVVVGPVMRYPRGGPAPPRVAEMNGGMVLDTGLQNRGVRSVLKGCSPAWSKLGCPVVVQVAEREFEDLWYVVSRLEQASGAAGVELLVHPDADAEGVAGLVGRIVMDSELPVWVKLPLDRATELAGPAVEAGAHALVIAQPPRGALNRRDWGLRLQQEPAAGENARLPAGTVRGSVYGPLTFPLMLNALVEVAAQRLPAVLIACGGIHGWEQARQALNAGAVAVQVDSAIWVEPGLANQLVEAWSTQMGAGVSP